jgi:tetratricopeptide (TPR) repeat protein
MPRDTLVQGFWLPTITAAIALGQNDARRAIEVLEPSSKYERAITYTLGGSLYPAYVRGEAYLRAGLWPKAVAEFQKVIDQRGLVLNVIVGAVSHLQLGRAKALAGDREGARRAYDRFFDIWKEADPDVPILKSARKEASKLR